MITLGEHYRDYQTLMAHWQQVLPLTIHPIPYEALVRDPEPQIRGSLRADAFGGACAGEVNQPIYTRAIDAWRQYEAQLGPLVGVLACASTG
nr:sulfotransferase [Thiorhodovibrio winogradskyi]